jgi:predicted nucleic acid-binding protein
MSNQDKHKAIYWDSNAFLKHLKQEPEHELCDDVIAEAENGNLIIVTSVFTMTEVIHIKGFDKIPKSNRDKVVKLFNEDYIEYRVVTRKISELARDLVWDARKVKPKDAIHLATALDMGLLQLHTFDDDLIALSGKIGGTPPLQISKPRVIKAPSPAPAPKQEVFLK